MVRIVSVSGLGIDCFSENSSADGIVFEKENQIPLLEKATCIPKKSSPIRLSLGKNILCSSFNLNSTTKD